MDLEVLNDIFDLKPEVQVVKNEQPGRIIYRENETYYYEVTLNPSNTKKFTSSENDYMQLWNKLLHYVEQCQDQFIDVIKSSYTFEFCKGGKRHLHAFIYFKAKVKIAPMGLVYDLSEYCSKLLRRKISNNQCFPDFARVQTLPFCIQICHYSDKKIRPNWKDIKITSWQDYIKKNAFEN